MATGRRISLGYEADTDRTVDFTVTRNNSTAAAVINISPVPAYLINSTNSGNPVKIGSSFSSSVTGFTGVASGTIGGKALTGLSYSSSTITATAPSFVDGATFYEPDTNQTLTYVNGSETASATIPTSSPDTMASVKLVSPNSVDPTYPAYYFPMTADDRMVGPTEGGNFVIGTDSGISTTTAGTRTCWHWNHTTSVMTQLSITVNDAGDVTDFTFGARTNIALSTLTTGTTQAVIAGVTEAIDIEATPSGGLECRVSTDDGGTFGSWTSAPFNTQLGYVVEGRIMSSASYNTLVTGSLTIGTTVGTLAVTTRLSDAAPDEFSFESVDRVTPNAIIASPTTVTISGVDIGIDIPTTVSGGLEYRYDDGGGYSAWTTAANDLQVGYDVQVRLQAPGVSGDTATGTLTMGGVSGTFTVRASNSGGGVDGAVGLRPLVLRPL